MTPFLPPPDMAPTPAIERPYQRREEGGTLLAGDPPNQVFRITRATTDGLDPLTTGDITPIEWSGRAADAPTEATSAFGAEEFRAGDIAQYSNRIEHVAAQRAEMLAKRYAAKQVSPELEARLRILNEQLKVLLPPVSEEELQALEEMALHGKVADAALDEIEARWGLG